MIDWAQLRQLQDDIGKDEMDDVVELFLCEVDEALATFEDDYEEMSLEDRSASFHFLKGCAANLGFKDFGHLCSEAEQDTKNGKDPTFQISDLVSLYAQSTQAFKEGYETHLS